MACTGGNLRSGRGSTARRLPRNGCAPGWRRWSSLVPDAGASDGISGATPRVGPPLVKLSRPQVHQIPSRFPRPRVADSNCSWRIVLVAPSLVEPNAKRALRAPCSKRPARRPHLPYVALGRVWSVGSNGGAGKLGGGARLHRSLARVRHEVGLHCTSLCFRCCPGPHLILAQLRDLLPRLFLVSVGPDRVALGWQAAASRQHCEMSCRLSHCCWRIEGRAPMRALGRAR